MPDPTKTTGSANYIKLFLLAKLFRGGFILGTRISSLLGHGPVPLPGIPIPTGEHLTIPSSKSRRRIHLTIYKNAAALSAEKSGLPSAVHIHFYGGGWMLPHWPAKTMPLISTLLAGVSTPLTVIDATYALAPEYPYPADLEDARDVYDYICAHHDRWDKEKITLSGDSSGGAISLGLAVALGKEARETRQHTHPIKALVVYYAMTNWVDIHERNITFLSSLPADAPRVMPNFVMDTIQASHFFSSNGASEEEEKKRKHELERLPSVSPALADVEDFPPRIGIWTVQWDVMSGAADELRERLKGSNENGNTRVSGRMIMGVGHGWDAEVREGQVGWDERAEAYGDLVEAIIWAGKEHVE